MTAEVKKRKRGRGPFTCLYPDCGKIFSRSDHLARHSANHTSGIRYICQWPECGRPFTRLDVKKKHESRHRNGDKNGNLKFEDDDVVSSTLSPSQLIRWLLQDPINVSPTSGRYTTHPENGAFHGLHDGTLGSTTVAMLEEIFALTPEFPNANYQTDVDESLLVEMFKFIPSLKKNPDFESHKIKWFLEIYWLLYHSQYPILHRPSFSTYQVHPLLLLSMIMIGASFAKKTHVPEHIQLVDAEKLADQIADPLRWLLFSCDQAKPPCNSWVIQSLLLLETFEITQTSRSLHERACIYNGAKIQLLRRSPILGGDPLKAVGTTDLSQSTSLWNTWIESESMKRVAWMSFYIDTIHAVVFGHPVNLYANQVKLSLPCTEEFWEYDNIDRNNAPASIVQMPIFSDSLKKLLQKEPVNTGPFGRKILLAGLLNLILQLELKDSQSSIMGWHSVKESWQETISSALEFWKSQLPGQSCCSTTTCVYHTEADGDLPLPSSFLPNDTRCKFPEYHAAQIYLRISHYDYIVYAGAPKRMNVPILPEDYEVVVKRISKWVKSPSGPVCVIHSLIILCEMLISADNSMNYIYDAHSDPFIYRPNVVISAILSLWSYAFHSFGPESLFMAPDSRFQITGQYVPALEDACSYLRRVRDKLGECTGRPFSSLESLDSSTYGIAVKQYASCLNKVENLNNLVGLLFTLRNAYRDCKWETGKEYSKLLDNCMQRSMGSSNIFCVDMYDVRDLAA
ncbi:hypothetical protein CANARDRAFT_200315 [[Candida] arabinofermentans NRRL YB-2248]|uniref:C2H2-type domain-containing protein n=1 Tax=[Candida] arabinofermentans NRRL YB-2248 TaxID=983967 RepID=A0A1E4SZ52_9ASCO|nr:hypothetical protein CANARDRAFT_200315 [[Candida] arabinofermentans NRRL YB-2248]